MASWEARKCIPILLGHHIAATDESPTYIFSYPHYHYFSSAMHVALLSATTPLQATLSFHHLSLRLVPLYSYANVATCTRSGLTHSSHPALGSAAIYGFSLSNSWSQQSYEKDGRTEPLIQLGKHYTECVLLACTFSQAHM